MAPACDLIDGLAAENIIADKAYDGQRLYNKVIAQGGDPVVPPRRHRKQKHAYDQALYKEHHRVETFFSRIKQCRRKNVDLIVQGFARGAVRHLS